MTLSGKPVSTFRIMLWFVLRVGSNLAVNVGPEFGGIGLGIALGEIRRSVDDLADLGVDSLQFLLADLGGEQAIANLLDRVLVVADLVDLFAGPILGRV